MLRASGVHVFRGAEGLSPVRVGPNVNQNRALRYGAGGNSGVLATALNVPHNVSNVYWLVRPIEH